MTSQKPSDEYIVRSVIKGDTESFRLIVQRYQNHIYNIGMRFFKNMYDSYDFVQEVFLKVFDKLDSYKGKAPFRNWLIKIAYNTAVNSVKNQKQETYLDEMIQSYDPDPEKLYLEQEIKQILIKAIDDLPETYRICLDFYFFWGLSYNEIKEITGFPINTIKSNVFRAKKTLRQTLRKDVEEDYHEL